MKQFSVGSNVCYPHTNKPIRSECLFHCQVFPGRSQAGCIYTHMARRPITRPACLTHSHTHTCRSYLAVSLLTPPPAPYPNETRDCSQSGLVNHHLPRSRQGRWLRVKSQLALYLGIFFSMIRSGRDVNEV